MQVSKVAFLGTGVMGFSMARHLCEHGFEVTAYNRTYEKALPLQEFGAKVVRTIEEAVADADAVLSIVGFEKDVEEVWLGEKGALKYMKPGAIGADMTTSDPALARKITAAAAEKGLRVGDAPVTGGDVGAKNGTLTIFFGGEEQLYEDLKPLMAAMGKTYERFGDAGAGQLTKACNQVAIAAGMMAMCESLVFAKKCNLDAEKVLKALQGGSAGSFSLTSYGPRILKGDYAPGFYMKHFIKDLKIALRTAQEHDLELPGTALALKLYEMLASEGKGDLGTQALYQYYDRQ